MPTRILGNLPLILFHLFSSNQVSLKLTKSNPLKYFQKSSPLLPNPATFQNNSFLLFLPIFLSFSSLPTTLPISFPSTLSFSSPPACPFHVPFLTHPKFCTSSLLFPLPPSLFLLSLNFSPRLLHIS